MSSIYPCVVLRSHRPSDWPSRVHLFPALPSIILISLPHRRSIASMKKSKRTRKRNQNNYRPNTVPRSNRVRAGALLYQKHLRPSKRIRRFSCVIYLFYYRFVLLEAACILTTSHCTILIHTYTTTIRFHPHFFPLSPSFAAVDRLLSPTAAPSPSLSRCLLHTLRAHRAPPNPNSHSHTQPLVI